MKDAWPIPGVGVLTNFVSIIVENGTSILKPWPDEYMYQVRRFCVSQAYATRSYFPGPETMRFQVPIVSSIQGMTLMATKASELRYKKYCSRGLRSSS